MILSIDNLERIIKIHYAFYVYMYINIRNAKQSLFTVTIFLD